MSGIRLEIVTNTHTLSTRRSDFNYYGQSACPVSGNQYAGMLCQEIVEPSRSTQKTTTTHYYNSWGNLKQRRDRSGSKNLTENFTYDDLNRLKTSKVVGRSRKDVTYDSYGNIRSKTGVGTYSYSNARPNAVSAAGGVTYAYDDNGNNTSSSDGRVITYNSFDKVKSAAKGGHTTSFEYGPDRARYKRIDTKSGNTTLYIGNVEKITYPNNTRAIKRYIDWLVIKTLNYNSGRTLTSTDTHYTLSDHLGSVDVITSGSGAITQQLSYDAWDLRRNAVSWQDLAASSITNFNTDLTRCGFTGHEHMDEVGIIHMNGRIYDPRLGRFLQADSFVPDPGNVASHNRYSYVYNNPLNATDPSGHFVFTLVATAWLISLEAAAWMVAVVVGVAAFADALVQGASFQEALKSGLIAGATAGAFSAIGAANLNFIGGSELLTQSVVFGAVGGISSVLQGGKFGHGFVSAGFSGPLSGKLANVVAPALGSTGAKFIARVVVGGTLSDATGGKFTNGATSAAFAVSVSAGVESLQEVDGVGTANTDMFTKNLDLADNITIDENGNVTIRATVSAETGQKNARNTFFKRVSGTRTVKSGCNIFGGNCSKSYKLTIDISVHTGGDLGDLHVVSRASLAAVNPRFASFLSNPSRCTFACATTGGNYIHVNDLSLSSNKLRHELDLGTVPDRQEILCIGIAGD